LETAVSYYKKAVEKYFPDGERLQQVTTNADAVELSQIYNRLGQVLHDRGDVQSAAEHYRKALRLQQKILRSGHPRIAETFMNMARNQRDSGEGFAAALATLAQAESLLQDGASTPEYASLLSMKADILREEGRLEEAEEFARRALALQEQEGSEETPDLAVSLNGLGSILHDQRKYKFAVKHYMRALSVNQKTVGTTHPETAATYNNLGNVYQDSGDDEAAERYYLKCLEIQKELLDKQSPGPELAASYNNIATIYVRQERYEEAERLLIQAVDVVRVAGLPSGSPDRAIYEENLAEVRQHLKKDSPPVSEEQDANAAGVTS
jgi:tetratricopeptide (TPR) repeat protein